jgi:hypothetical protein
LLKVADALLVVLSDMHTGGSTALFPRNGYQIEGAEGNFIKANDRQVEIHHTWTRFAAEVAVTRKGRRMIVINLGDAVDGIHHNSLQECLFNIKDQCAAHVALMDEFKKKTGFTKGDELYYVRGTEVHVGETENEMAEELGAAKAESGLYVNEILTLNINGLNVIFLHHGKGRGNGVNEGNALRNYLRDTRDARRKDGLPKVDVMVSGHTHGHLYSNHVEREPGGNYHIFHGIICPSWQAKTRFAYAKVPAAVNSIGGLYVKIGADGTFGLPKFVVQVTKDL